MPACWPATRLPMAMSFCRTPGHMAKCRSAGRAPDRLPTALGTPATVVEIPDTGFSIAGYIDRLDISGDGKRALVRDYKTGRPPKDHIRLNGGQELQRCLYAFAVKASAGR